MIRKLFQRFVFTCNRVWNRNKIISAAEFRSSNIISRLFHFSDNYEQWTCWKISMSLIRLCNNFETRHSPPRYRNAASHASPYGPLRPNVTSSIKPEIHNVSQRRQSRTESRPQGIYTKNRSNGSRDMLGDRQTDTHTHTQRQTDRNTPLP